MQTTSSTPSLRLHRDFLKLWLSWTISISGSQISTLAIPLAAALLLDAAPLQMGALIAVKAIPHMLFGLFAGVWVDRGKRLSILIWSDLASAIFLLAIPLAAWFHVLTIGLLCIVAFLCGTVTVVAGPAHQSYITTLVGREYLVEAHSRLYATGSCSEALGPGLAGLLISAVGAPFAILFDAITFMVSGAILKTIKSVESEGEKSKSAIGFKKEIGESLTFITQSSLMRSLVGTLIIWQLIFNIYGSVIILFALKELKLTAALVGAAFSMAGVGTFLAVLFAKRIVNLFGVGKTILNGFLVAAIAWQALAQIESNRQLLSASLLGLGVMLFSFGGASATINYIALRQALTPNSMLGRMTSIMQFLTVGISAPVGAILGGLLGAEFGMRTTLMLTSAVAMALLLVATLVTPISLSSIRQMPRQPEKST